MLKWIETTGRSEEDAISAALFQLGLERDDVSVEVIERAKSGFLGFGSNPAKVRVSYEEENGIPCPKKDPLKEAAALLEVEKEEMVQASAPVREVEASAQPVAPVEEETILAAKPGMGPVKKSQPHVEQMCIRDRDGTALIVTDGKECLGDHGTQHRLSNGQRILLIYGRNLRKLL